MKTSFDDIIKVVLHHEGGYVNHPQDPGGETNLGVTKRVYEEWGGKKSILSEKNLFDQLLATESSCEYSSC